MAALLIVVGLAVSVPPSFSTAAGEHFGLLVHPLFPHVHATSQQADSRVDAAAAREGSGLSASDGLWQQDHAPGIRGHVPEEGFRSTLSGIVLPTLIVGVFLQLRQVRTAALRLGHQHWQAPQAPPPRLLAPVVVTR